MTGSDSIPFFEYQRWFRQRRPYDAPLAYEAKRYGITVATREELRHSGDALPWLDENNGVVDATNQAYARFVGRTRAAQASLGVTIAQYKQSSDMIAKRAGTLANFADFLARGAHEQAGVYLNRVTYSTHDTPAGRREKERRNKRFKDAAKRARKKGFAGAFLEYSFGWAPLVGDIYAASVVLHSVPKKPFVARGFATRSGSYELKPGPSSVNIEEFWKTKVMMRANVRVVNPNLRRLQDLGLVNPALIAWDAIPWSFVVGWFFNVSQVVSSWTDLIGLEMEYPSTTVVKDVRWEKTLPAAIPPYHQKGYGLSTVRSLTLAKPKLTFQGIEFSPTRAALAISLLLQKLPR